MANFGRRLLHDPRSREHELKPAAAAVTGVRHAMNSPHLNQFYLGACVGFAGAQFFNTAKASRNRRKYNALTKDRGIRYLDNADGIENYHQATVYDPFEGQYPPTDEGSSALGLMKWWHKIGVIRSYSWTFTFDAFLGALQHQPVLVGTMWFDDMMSTGADGIIRSTASGDGGGHEYLATEIITPGTRKYGQLFRELHIGCEQSWGEEDNGFGSARDPGRFFIPGGLAEELIIHQQGDVAVPELMH